MSEYPRELLITEDVIREFEEVVGVRFINKTECAKALKAHDAKIRAEAIDEFINMVRADFEFKVDNINYTDDIIEHLQFIAEQLKEQKNDGKRDKT